MRTYKNNYNVISVFSESNNPIKCFTGICKNSSLRNVYNQCQGVTCIQNLSMKVRDSQLTGTEIRQIQQCGYDIEDEEVSKDIDD